MQIHLFVLPLDFCRYLVKIYLNELVPSAAQLSIQILLVPRVGAELQGCPLFSEEL